MAIIADVSRLDDWRLVGTNTVAKDGHGKLYEDLKIGNWKTWTIYMSNADDFDGSPIHPKNDNERINTEIRSKHEIDDLCKTLN